MGSKNSKQQITNKCEFINHNKHYLNAITLPIYRQISAAVYEDIVALCIQFIGYFMDSSIICMDKSSILYNIMLEDHKHRNIVSPLLNKHYISHFELLYRASGDFVDNFSSHFKSNLLNIPNLLIVFETVFDHKYSFYMKTPIKKESNAQNKDIKYTALTPDVCGLYLIQSQFEYGSLRIPALTMKRCPRTVGIVDSERVAFRICLKRDFFIGDVFIGFDIYGEFGRHSCNQRSSIDMAYDLSGNELVGGPGNIFDDARPIHAAKFKQIEVFHIL